MIILNVVNRAFHDEANRFFCLMENGAIICETLHSVEVVRSDHMDDLKDYWRVEIPKLKQKYYER